MIFLLKLLICSLWTAVVFTFAIPFCLVLWGSGRRSRLIFRAAVGPILWVWGLRIKAEGPALEAARPCVYVMNHQSAMDVAVMGAIMPDNTLMIAKKQIVWVPLVGWVYALAGNLLIDRKRWSQAAGRLAMAVDRIQRRGASVFVFPEGTRNTTSQPLLPFKRGPFHIAIAAGVPIVPVVVAPLAPFWNPKAWLLRGGTLRIRYLPPIPSSGLTVQDAGHLAERTREVMLEALRGFPA